MLKYSRFEKHGRENAGIELRARKFLRFDYSLVTLVVIDCFFFILVEYVLKKR
jgi:hypothetical protein